MNRLLQHWQEEYGERWEEELEKYVEQMREIRRVENLAIPYYRKPQTQSVNSDGGQR